MTSALSPGEVYPLAPGVRRLVAPNPGMMTGPGTNTWLLGEREIAVIDPGPAIPAHLERILEAAAASGAAIRSVLVTHTHSDHSPGALPLAERTGAELLGLPPPAGRHQDATFRPDRLLADGAHFCTDEFTLDVIHTPGHASNQLCYYHRNLGWLFTGDHIINGSTVVIDPPDGNMSHYLRSLEKLQRYSLAAIAPGHGEMIEKPLAAIDALIRHRLERERTVLETVTARPGLSLQELVALVYAGVDSALHPVAERSLLAHLQKLQDEGRIACRDECWHVRFKKII